MKKLVLQKETIRRMLNQPIQPKAAIESIKACDDSRPSCPCSNSCDIPCSKGCINDVA